MKKFFLLSVVVLMGSCSSNAVRDARKFQQELNAEYLNPKETPLRGENFAKFKAHPFFPINSKYRIEADFTLTKNAVPFEIPTSSGKTKPYREYGKAAFILDGKKLTLTVYQSLTLIQKKGFEDHLFLPLRDETNGKETYGGGRYLDLKIPKTHKIIIDFNRAYQPYCAYNAFDYSCPIVPEENFLPVSIEAGVKYDDVFHH